MSQNQNLQNKDDLILTTFDFPTFEIIWNLKSVIQHPNIRDGKRYQTLVVPRASVQRLRREDQRWRPSPVQDPLGLRWRPLHRHWVLENRTSPGQLSDLHHAPEGLGRRSWVSTSGLRSQLYLLQCPTVDPLLPSLRVLHHDPRLGEGS